MSSALAPDQPAIPSRSREVRLARRPEGLPVPDDFAVVSVDVPRPGPGELLVRNLVFSVDPYMRGRMSAGPSYAPGWELGEAMVGGAIGEVVVDGSGALARGPSWSTGSAGVSTRSSRAARRSRWTPLGTRSRGSSGRSG